MRKHISWYLKGMKDAVKIRQVINKVTTAAEMEDILNLYLEKTAKQE